MSIKKVKSNDIQYDIKDSRVPALEKGKQLESHDGVLQWADKDGTDPHVAGLLDATITEAVIENVTEVKDEFLDGCEHLGKLSVSGLNGPVGKHAFYGLIRCSEFHWDPENVITELGSGAFSGLGMNRNTTERFFLDLRNSMFEECAGFGDLDVPPVYQSGSSEIITPAIPGIGIWNAEIRLPSTVTTFGITAEQGGSGGSGSSGGSGYDGVFNNCEDIDLYINSNVVIELSDVASVPVDAQSHIYVKFNMLADYAEATNWASLENLYGFATEEEFPVGSILPNVDTRGFEVTWASDRAHEQIITEAIEGEMYAQQTGERLFTTVTLTIAYKGTIDITIDGTHYKPGDLLPLGATATITAVPDDGTTLTSFEINGVDYTSSGTAEILTSIEDIDVQVVYDIMVAPKWMAFAKAENCVNRLPSDIVEPYLEDGVALVGYYVDLLPIYIENLVIDEWLLTPFGRKRLFAVTNWVEYSPLPYLVGAKFDSFRLVPVKNIVFPASVVYAENNFSTENPVFRSYFVESIRFLGAPRTIGFGGPSTINKYWGGTVDQYRSFSPAQIYASTYSGTNRVQCSDGDYYGIIGDRNGNNVIDYWDFDTMGPLGGDLVSRFVNVFVLPRVSPNTPLWSGKFRVESVIYPGTIAEFTEAYSGEKAKLSLLPKTVQCSDGPCILGGRTRVLAIPQGCVVSINGEEHGVGTYLASENDEATISWQNSVSKWQLGTHLMEGTATVTLGDYFIDGNDDLLYIRAPYTLSDTTLCVFNDNDYTCILGINSVDSLDAQLNSAYISYNGNVYKVVEIRTTTPGNTAPVIWGHNGLQRVVPGGTASYMYIGTWQVILGENLEEISLGSFAVNDNCTRIELPASVTNIRVDGAYNEETGFRIFVRGHYQSSRFGDCVTTQDGDYISVGSSVDNSHVKMGVGVPYGPVNAITSRVALPMSITTLKARSRSWQSPESFSSANESPIGLLLQIGNITRIEDKAGYPFENLKLNTRLQYLGHRVWPRKYGRPIEISYLGTMSQWEAITKEDDWYLNATEDSGFNAGVSKVICTDGEISLVEEE